MPRRLPPLRARATRSPFNWKSLRPLVSPAVFLCACLQGLKAGGVIELKGPDLVGLPGKSSTGSYSDVARIGLRAASGGFNLFPPGEHPPAVNGGPAATASAIPPRAVVAFPALRPAQQERRKPGVPSGGSRTTPVPSSNLPRASFPKHGHHDCAREPDAAHGGRSWCNHVGRKHTTTIGAPPLSGRMGCTEGFQAHLEHLLEGRAGRVAMEYRDTPAMAGTCMSHSATKGAIGSDLVRVHQSFARSAPSGMDPYRLSYATHEKARGEVPYATISASSFATDSQYL